jgi:sterol desaturase/sphingolipid hydroxylase (fatty acid hydroxylase superfamily)
MNFVVYAIPIFILMIAIEWFWDKRQGNNYYRLNDTVNSLSMGILSTTSRLVFIDISGRVFTLVQQYFSIATWTDVNWWMIVVAFVFYDFCYYWFHRISHEKRLFWASHVAHHQSEEYNLSTALRQTSTSFWLTWVFYVPCFMLGMPTEVFVSVASANLVYQFWVHTRYVPALGWYEKIFVSPSNHRVHHARNPEYIDKNYGGVFIIFDRLFGTYLPERKDLAVDFGITRGLNSWNPIWANLHVYACMIKDSIATPQWRDKLRVWFGATGFVAPGIVKAPVQSGNLYDPLLSVAQKAYVIVQFLLVFVLSTAMLYTPLSFNSLLILFTFLLLSLVSIGWIMDGKHYALEWLRMAVGLGLLFTEPAQPLIPTLTTILGVNLLWLIYLQRQKKATLVKI